MNLRFARISITILGLVILLTGFSLLTFHAQTVHAQVPTVDIPTVTSSPSGPMIKVRADAGEEQINVRSGPGTFYDKVGVLLIGQTAPAKGRSTGGEWIMVEYLGAPGNVAWVYAPLVDILSPSLLTVVEAPPTPTPVMTNTIDPTLAAQFVVTSEPTRLATFTAPPPLNLPTFEPVMASSRGGIPMGLVIIGLAAIGLSIGLFTLAQGK